MDDAPPGDLLREKIYEERGICRVHTPMASMPSGSGITLQRDDSPNGRNLFVQWVGATLKQVYSWGKFFERCHPKMILHCHKSSDVCRGREVIDVFFVSFERYERQPIARWFSDKR
ncbi:uncharacterized protein V6R79_025456 [Siganus canaliculatus]